MSILSCSFAVGVFEKERRDKNEEKVRMYFLQGWGKKKMDQIICKVLDLSIGELPRSSKRN